MKRGLIVLLTVVSTIALIFVSCRKDEPFLPDNSNIKASPKSIDYVAATYLVEYKYAPNMKDISFCVYTDANRKNWAGEKVVTANTSGRNEITLEDLKPNTTYYTRFKVSNKKYDYVFREDNFTTKKGSLAQVTTSSITSITTTTAVCGGNVTSAGGGTVTARGVCWSTSQNPTISNSHTTNGSGTGSFTSNITGLTAGKTYFVRAYATNSAGTSYGVQKLFTTITLPTVTTSAVSGITTTSAVCGGNVASADGETVTARGVCWSTSQNPTISNSHTTNGSGTGSFTSIITGLTAGKTYYVRAYATNSGGTAYGAQRSFTTTGVTLPTVTTSAVSSITTTTAVCGGNVTSAGVGTVTARGVCWSTSQNPTIYDSYTTNGSGMGSFTSNIAGLAAGTTYYVRAYATNSAGTAYGAQVSFKTNNPASYTFTANGVSFTMKLVEGGTFQMGAQSTNASGANYDADAQSEESPIHNVTLSTFYMGQTEVTQALWQAVMGSNPSNFTGNSQRPVETVSYNDCLSFISTLNSLLASQLNGKTFRLPTEAEWEYAARGGQNSAGYKYSGSNTIGNVAWYEANASSTTHPVMQKQANELGLYDMSGNVREWCQDWSSGYSSSSQTNPQGPSSGSNRVYRGGGWSSYERYCRVSDRLSNYPSFRGSNLGLRLVLLP